MKKVLFRVDAYNEIGYGHLFRCISLALEFQKKGITCSFISYLDSDSIYSYARQNLFKIYRLNFIQRFDYDSLKIITTTTKYDFFVIDGYHFNLSYENLLHDLVGIGLAIDDYAANTHCCEFVLDQNIGEIGLSYISQNSKVTLFLGPEYTLIRPEFKSIRKKSLHRNLTHRKFVKRLLVFFGGGNVNYEILKVASAISSIENNLDSVDFVIGANFEKKDELLTISKKISNANIHIDTKDMANLMLSSDFGILSAGTVSWEKCVLGLPSLALAFAENQIPTLNHLKTLGAHMTIDQLIGSNKIDYTSLIMKILMSNNTSYGIEAAKICDGDGANRVIAKILESKI